MKLSKTQKQVIKLLTKLEELGKKEDFNSQIFAQPGGHLILLNDPTPEESAFEMKKEYILKHRIIHEINISCDGGDADYRDENGNI